MFLSGCCAVMMAVVSMSLVVTVLVAMTGFHPSEGRVDYKCVYGPMMSVTGERMRAVYVCVCVLVFVSTNSVNTVGNRKTDLEMTNTKNL